MAPQNLGSERKKGLNMRVLVDSDGVVVDFMTSFLDGYRGYGGIVPEGWAPDAFDSIKQLPTKKALRASWNDPELFSRALPYEGAIDALEALNWRHGEVYIVTAFGIQTDLHVPAKYRWYQKYAPFLKYDQFIFTNKKHMVTGDVLIEDKTGTIIQWAELYPESLVIAIDQQWNQDLYERAYTRNIDNVHITQSLYSAAAYLEECRGVA